MRTDTARRVGRHTAYEDETAWLDTQRKMQREAFENGFLAALVLCMMALIILMCSGCSTSLAY